MKSKIIMPFFLFVFNHAFSQLTNFGSDGKKLKILTETDSSIVVTNLNLPNFVPNAVPLVLGAIEAGVGVGLDVTQAALTKREEGFTATYTSMYTDSSFLYNNQFHLDELKFYRLFTTEKDAKKKIASEITLKFKPSNNLFRLKLESLLLNYSKARIKKCGKSGRTIDISIGIEINGIWTDYKGSTSSLKSATLGASSIIIPGIKPGGKEYDFSQTNSNNLYSDWYQMIPFAPEKTPESRNSRGYYTITITIREANAAAIGSNNLVTFLNSNSSDISKFIKSFLPKQ
jgi:hypothetical protein